MRKVDLIALSESSKYMRKACWRQLWQSITIGPWSEDGLHKMAVAGLPPMSLQLTTSLRFHADILHATTRRCPHGKEYLCSDDISENGSNSECDNEGDKSRAKFTRLSQRAKTWLEQLDGNQLQEFR